MDQEAVLEVSNDTRLGALCQLYLADCLAAKSCPANFAHVSHLESWVGWFLLQLRPCTKLLDNQTNHGSCANAS